MEGEEPLGRRGRDVVAFLLEAGRKPERLLGALLVVDIDLAPALIRDDEPDEAGSHDEPDHEQPPVELGVHRREV
jgi:hypothetical protein